MRCMVVYKRKSAEHTVRGVVLVIANDWCVVVQGLVILITSFLFVSAENFLGAPASSLVRQPARPGRSRLLPQTPLGGSALPTERSTSSALAHGHRQTPSAQQRAGPGRGVRPALLRPCSVFAQSESQRRVETDTVGVYCTVSTGIRALSGSAPLCPGHSPGPVPVPVSNSAVYQLYVVLNATTVPYYY